MNLWNDDCGAIDGVLFYGQQSFIRLIERKHRYLWLETDLRGEGQKIASIGAGHVGDATNLAFAPQQAVIVELRHAIKMDGIDGDHASFAKTSEGGDHNVSCRSEGNGAIECDWRLLGFRSNPGRAEGVGKLAMRFSAGGNVDIAFPRLQDSNGKVGRCAEAKQSHALALLYARNAEAAKADDAGTKQRRGVEIVERGRQRKNEIGASQGILGISAGNRVARERGMVAEILFAAAAVRTHAVGAADPGNTDAGSEGNFVACHFDDFTHNLVTGNDLWMLRRKIAFHDVEISAADTTGSDAEKDVAGFQFGIGDVGDSQRTLRDGLRRTESSCFHELPRL